MSKKLVIYLPEGFADWEGAYLMPELVENKRSFITVSESGKPVTSIGGLKVTPDAALGDVVISDIQGLVLIGSDGWVDPAKNQKVLALAGQLLNQGTLLAAICAATVALGRVGLLDNHKHTSNDLDFLKKINPTYKGEKNYLDQLAVQDKNLITAAGIGPIEFTLEIMRALDIYSEEKRKHWFAMFKYSTKPPVEFWS